MAESAEKTSQGNDLQPSTASQQHETMRIEIVVQGNPRPTDEPPFSRLEERFKSVTEFKDSGRTPSKFSLMPKVPQILRDTKDFKRQFEPRVVSVGPYHHHKPEVKQVRRLKLQLTKQFIHKSGKRIGDFYSKIASDVPELRKCYSKKATRRYNDEDLAWMMLVDGCSLLEYMQRYVEGKLKDLHIIYQHASFVQQDLFLLENQLPFQFLIELLELRFEEAKEGRKIIEKFISKSMGSSQATIDEPKEEDPVHLLDLLRKKLLGEEKPKDGESKDYSCRNVNELKESGILFRPSNTNSWTDISFNSWLFIGFLKLPAITIDDSTKSRFFNLIAYEMCPDAKGSGVTSYICFLDSLIDKAEDVRELRRKGIVINLLGSDDEVATLFNEIVTDLVPDSHAYAAVKGKIQNHCKSKMKTWLAEAWFTHFSSPWTILAFLGAVIALLLTGVQTYYTLHPPGNH